MCNIFALNLGLFGITGIIGVSGISEVLEGIPGTSSERFLCVLNFVILRALNESGDVDNVNSYISGWHKYGGSVAAEVGEVGS